MATFLLGSTNFHKLAEHVLNEWSGGKCHGTGIDIPYSDETGVVDRLMVSWEEVCNTYKGSRGDASVVYMSIASVEAVAEMLKKKYHERYERNMKLLDAYSQMGSTEDEEYL